MKNIYNVLIFIISTVLANGMLNESQFHELSINSNWSVIPMHYNIMLSPNIEMDGLDEAKINEYKNISFEGDSSIIINILYPTQSIKLQWLCKTFDDFTSGNFSVKLSTKNGIICKLSKLLYSLEKNLLQLYFYDILLPGFYSLKMKFVSILDDNVESLIKSSYINEAGYTKWIFAINVQATGARQLFPCWDEPLIKATFAISILHHRNAVAISNMPKLNTTHFDKNLTWTYFQTTPPISTYHIVIVMTNYNRIRINKNVFLWCKEYLQKNSFELAMQVIQNVTSYLESEFEEILIESKIDHIAIINFAQDITSKWGIIFHRETDLICDQKLDPIMQKIEMTRLISFKIAYQWFGNAISPTMWSFLWLHDSLATLFGEEAVTKVFNNSEIMDFFIVQNQYESLHLDSHFNMNPPLIVNNSEINSLYRFPCYIKGPIVLRMLQSGITDAAFRKGVHIYLYKYIFRSLTPSEFWYIQQDVSNVSYQDSIRIDFPNWLMHRHYPVLIWIQEQFSSGRLDQHFDTSASYKGNWSIPTGVIRKSLIPDVLKVWLTPQNPYSHVNYVNTANNWIMVDILQAGYYRIYYDGKNLEKIVNYLKSEEYKNIHVINRAKIIDDVFHFMIESQFNISAHTFWQLTTYLSNETNYVAWFPMIKLLEYISFAFPLIKDEIKKFHLNNIMENIRDLLTKSLDTLGFEERPNENDLTQCLRQEISKWACILKYPKCLKKAKYKLEQHLKYPDLFKISSGWKKWTFCNGFITMNANTWEFIEDIWIDKSGSKYVEYFGCFQDKSSMHLLLGYLKSQRYINSSYLTQEELKARINIFHSVVGKHDPNNDMLEIIIPNLWDIKPIEISRTAALIDLINHVYSIKQLQKINSSLTYGAQLYSGLTSKAYFKIGTRLSQIENQIDYFENILF